MAIRKMYKFFTQCDDGNVKFVKNNFKYKINICLPHYVNFKFPFNSLKLVNSSLFVTIITLHCH